MRVGCDELCGRITMPHPLGFDVSSRRHCYPPSLCLLDGPILLVRARGEPSIALIRRSTPSRYGPPQISAVVVGKQSSPGEWCAGLRIRRLCRSLRLRYASYRHAASLPREFSRYSFWWWWRLGGGGGGDSVKARLVLAVVLVRPVDQSRSDPPTVPADTPTASTRSGRCTMASRRRTRRLLLR